MKTTPKLPRSTDRATGRMPRVASDTPPRAALPPAMGNRAFIRAWAARRAKLSGSRNQAPGGRI